MISAIFLVGCSFDDAEVAYKSNNLESTEDLDKSINSDMDNVDTNPVDLGELDKVDESAQKNSNRDEKSTEPEMTDSNNVEGASDIDGVDSELIEFGELI